MANAKVAEPHSNARTTLLEPWLKKFEEGWEASINAFERAQPLCAWMVVERATKVEGAVEASGELAELGRSE